MIGKRFGRLVVVSFSHKDSAHKSCYVCRCDCGSLIVARANNLKTGNTKSCGCFNIDRIIERNNVIIEFNGKSLCRAEWEELLGFTKDLIRNRLRRGWSLEKTFTTPIIREDIK